MQPRALESAQVILMSADPNALIIRDVVQRALRADTRGVLRTLKRAGKYVIAASALLAAIGFCLSVFHYHRRGVPLHSLSYPQFLGAGLLAAAWVQSVNSAGMYLAASRFRIAIRELLVWGGLVVFIVGPMGLQTERPWAIALLWMAYTAVIACSLRYIIKIKIRALALPEDTTPTRATEPSEFVRTPSCLGTVGYWVGTLAVFANFVFPHVPQWAGGGKPREVQVLWSADLADDEQSYFFTSNEPVLLAPEPDQRPHKCVFEVLATENQLHLLTVDASADRRCSTAPTGWRAWNPFTFDRDPAQTFVTVPRSRVRILAYK